MVIRVLMMGEAQPDAVLGNRPAGLLAPAEDMGGMIARAVVRVGAPTVGCFLFPFTGWLAPLPLAPEGVSGANDTAPERVEGSPFHDIVFPSTLSGVR